MSQSLLERRLHAQPAMPRPGKLSFGARGHNLASAPPAASGADRRPAGAPITSFFRPAVALATLDPEASPPPPLEEPRTATATANAEEPGPGASRSGTDAPTPSPQGRFGLDTTAEALESGDLGEDDGMDEDDDGDDDSPGVRGAVPLSSTAVGAYLSDFIESIKAASKPTHRTTLSEQLKSGQIFFDPPNPRTTVRAAILAGKVPSPDPFYHPRVAVWLPEVQNPGLRVLCPDCKTACSAKGWRDPRKIYDLDHVYYLICR